MLLDFRIIQVVSCYRQIPIAACSMQRDAVHTFSLAVAVDVTARESDASAHPQGCLLDTCPSPRDQRGTRMPSSA